MMAGLIEVLFRINNIANTLGSSILAPVGRIPGWISLTIISAVLGVGIFLIFKYTSNQRAFTEIIRSIQANMLAVFLFKDNIQVMAKSEARLIICSGKLLVSSFIPVLIMSIPLSLILSQMNMWYQARPVHPGDESVIVNLKLNDMGSGWPAITLNELPAVRILRGPVRLYSRQEIYWEIQPLTEGYHTLIFQAGNDQFSKQLAAGTGFMRVSAKRPGAEPADIILYPLEKPFSAGSPVHSISIAYPERKSFIYGTNWWLVYFCVASMFFALLAKPFMRTGR